MTSRCLIFSACLCTCTVSVYIRLLAYRQFLRAPAKVNRTPGWLRWPHWSDQSRPLPQPFTLECFTLSVFIPLHSRLFAQNHIHDQTWSDPIKVMPQNTSVKPSDTSAIPQRWKQRRRSPFCPHGFWNGIEETLSREMREARHHKSSLWVKGLLLLVWSEATGTGLHSQVPEQNRRNLSGLNRTQNRRSQTSVSVCRRVWIPVRPHVCFSHLCH